MSHKHDFFVFLLLISSYILSLHGIFYVTLSVYIVNPFSSRENENSLVSFVCFFSHPICQ